MNQPSKIATIVIGIILVVVMTVLAAAFLMSPIGRTPSATQSDQVSKDTTTEYTAADVTKHATTTDCWTTINGNVYDITSYISQHPNQEITRACGIDATTLFTQRRTQSGEVIGTGQGHDASAAAQLAELQIGVLTK